MKRYSHDFGGGIFLEIGGESHGSMVTACLSGMPAGIAVDAGELSAFMGRRSSSGKYGTTARKEPDRPVFVSGIVSGVTDGGPIEIHIRNTEIGRAHV